MSLKKVSELAQKFQVKLAQDPFAGMTPEQLSSMPADKLQEKVFGPSPSAQKAPAPAPKPQLATAVSGPEDSELPADLKQMLDIGAPGTKGMLKLKLDGKNVSVAYNADRWHGGASNLKRVLVNALSPKYVVGDPIGYFKPEWTFNY